MNQVQKEHRLLFDISTVIRTCLSTLEKTDTDRISVGKSLYLFLNGSQKEAEIHIVPEDILDSLKKGDLRYCADILQQIVYKYGQVYTFPYMYLKSFSSNGKLQKINLIEEQEINEKQQDKKKQDKKKQDKKQQDKKTDAITTNISTEKTSPDTISTEKNIDTGTTVLEKKDEDTTEESPILEDTGSTKDTSEKKKEEQENMKNNPVEDDFSEEDSFSLEFVDEDEFNSQQQETQKQPSPPSNASDEKVANEVSTEANLSNDEIEKHTAEQQKIEQEKIEQQKIREGLRRRILFSCRKRNHLLEFDVSRRNSSHIQMEEKIVSKNTTTHSNKKKKHTFTEILQQPLEVCFEEIETLELLKNQNIITVSDLLLRPPTSFYRVPLITPDNMLNYIYLSEEDILTSSLLDHSPETLTSFSSLSGGSSKPKTNKTKEDSNSISQDQTNSEKIDSKTVGSETTSSKYFRIFPPNVENPKFLAMFRGKITNKWIRFGSFVDKYELTLSRKEKIGGVSQIIHLHIFWNGTPPRCWNEWQCGQTIAISGIFFAKSIDINGEDIHIFSHQSEPVGIDGRGSGILPRYEDIDVPDDVLRDVVAQIILQVCTQIPDPLPKKIREKVKLLPFEQAIRDAHYPSNVSFRGEQRLAFDELLSHQIRRKFQIFQARKIDSIQISHQSIAQLHLLKDISLQDEQEMAFDQIKRDLRSYDSMTRLLQGDVGAGKSTIALLSSVLVAEVRKLVLYITPNSFIAERKYLFAKPILQDQGIRVRFFPDDLQKDHLNLLKRNEVDIVFGSIKLLRQTKLWSNVHLVVSEEIGIPDNLTGRGQVSEKDEGRFGTTIRMPLFQSKETPNLLVYTPIPLPIVLIESLYPTFTISTITSKHDIPKSTTLPSEERNRAYNFLYDEVQRKRQGYIVLPQKGHEDVFSLSQTLDFVQALNKEFLPNVRLGIFSSHMSREDRIRVFDDFQRRRIDVLVCATSIEDSPVVGNATVAIVEYADKFDMTRLRRIQGHVARAHYDPNCLFVMSNDPTDQDKRLVKRVCTNPNGFRMVEDQILDMRQQNLLSDLPTYTWGESSRSLRIQVRNIVENLSLDDIRKNHYPVLNEAILKWSGYRVSQVSKRSNKKRNNYNKKNNKKKSYNKRSSKPNTSPPKKQP